MSPSHSPSRARLIPAAVLVVPAVLLILDNAAFRALEARTAQPLVGLLVRSGPSRAVGDVLFFGLGTPDGVGLRITAGCTTVVLLVPFLLVMAAVTARSTVPLSRVITATAIGSALLIAVNLIRLTGIAWATSRWGLTPGFEVSHFLVGSIFAIVGFAGALVLSVRLLVGGARAGGAHRGDRRRRASRRRGPRDARDHEDAFRPT